jgi:hypothetical protein
VVNVIGGGKPNNEKQGNGNGNGKVRQSAPKPVETPPTPEEQAEDVQKRFREMRAKLLNQDARTD